MQILNKKSDEIPNSAIYIGRGSALGNPYPIGEGGDRNEVIAKYNLYLNKELDSRNPIVWLKMLQLKEDSILACYCSPAPCHGNIIAETWTKKIKHYQNKRNLNYAGIGSRETPETVLRQMQKISSRLSELGFTLRSGGAKGADSAFEKGATRKDIYLPAPGYNGNKSPNTEPTTEAYRLAELLHPAWGRLDPFIKKLMARNCHQILGFDLRSPVDFVVCFTPDGVEKARDRTSKTGGTGLAIELADHFKIPIFNLKNRDALSRMGLYIKSNPEYHDEKTERMRL
jgi:hypothetical protein